MGEYDNDSLVFLNSLTDFQFWKSGFVVSTHYS